MNACPLLIGRSRELHVLREALSGGGVILVAGEAGLGKSRLLREFADQAREAGHPVVWGRPEFVTESGPYSLIIDLLEGVARGHDSGHEARQLAAALEAPPPGQPEPPARQIAARTRGLVAATGRQPVVVLEDLQGADEPSQAVIAHLARSARDDGVLLVGSYRPSEVSGSSLRLVDFLMRERLAENLLLSPLSADELALMLEAMWGRTPEPDELARVGELADGVPFFVEELAQVPAGQVPDSIARTVEARLGPLSTTARDVLQLASVSPGAVDPPVLSRAADLSDSELAGALRDGIHTGLLADSDGHIVFRHALLRQAVSDSILSLERRGIHERLAKAIQSLGTEDAERRSHALAGHLLASGDGPKAASWLVRAAERALSVGALEDSEALLGQAIGLVDSETETAARASRLLADIATRRGEVEQALKLLADIPAGDSPERFEASLLEARLRASLRDSRWRDSLREFEASSMDDPIRYAKLHLAIGYAHRSLGDLDFSRAALTSALEGAQAAGNLDLEAHVMVEFARLETSMGDLAAARRVGAEVNKLVQQHSITELVGAAATTSATRLALEGAAAEALEQLELARDSLSGGLASHLMVPLDQVRAWLLWRMGRPEEAERCSARLELLLTPQAYGRVVRVWAHLERGEVDAANELLDVWWSQIGAEQRTMSLDELAKLPESPEGGAYAMLGDAILAAFGTSPVSPDELSRADRYAQFTRETHPDVAAQGALLLARATLRAGDLERARTEIALGRELAGDSAPLQLAFADELEGRLMLHEGNPAAGPMLESAAERFRAADNESDLARIELALGSSSSGDRAVEYLKSARVKASAVGATLTANSAEAKLRELGIRPRAGRPKGSGRKKGTLSSREEEVTTLLASGATNSEIAARLFISERTVQDHIRNAQRQLKLTGRAALAAWAAKQGLI